MPSVSLNTVLSKTKDLLPDCISHYQSARMSNSTARKACVRVFVCSTLAITFLTPGLENQSVGEYFFPWVSNRNGRLISEHAKATSQLLYKNLIYGPNLARLSYFASPSNLPWLLSLRLFDLHIKLCHKFSELLLTSPLHPSPLAGEAH